jgi:hypothetical protein
MEESGGSWSVEKGVESSRKKIGEALRCLLALGN